MNDTTTDAAVAMGPVERGEWHELLELYQASNADERAVLMMVARQLQGKGRREYGPLDLRGPERREFTGEALAEIGDALAYVAIALRQVAIRRSNGKAG